MTMSNSQRVGDALQLLSKGLAPFVERELKTASGDDWVVHHPSRPTRMPTLRSAKTASLDDVQFLLKTMMATGTRLPEDPRPLRAVASSASSSRRGTAGRTTRRSPPDTLRALDSMQRLLVAVSAPAEAKELEELVLELQRLVFKEQTRQKTRQVSLIEASPQSGLRPGVTS